MDVLGIQAGRTDEEVAAARELRTQELRGEITSAANYFFWAAGFALVSSGVLPVRFGIFIGIGFIDLLYLYGGRFGNAQGLVIVAASLALIFLLIAMGAMARLQKRWAFMMGIALYAADMVALMATFSIWAIGVHGFFVYRWYQGQRAVTELSRDQT